MRLRFTETAREEFLAAIARIRRDKPGAVKKFRHKADRSFRRLTKFPLSGRKLPEFLDLPHCEVIVSPYRFLYRVEDKTVWIVAVWHGAQLPTPPR